MSALGARNESEVTFDVAKQHVIAEYERHAKAVAGFGDSVLKTVAKVGVCFFCKKPNHQKKNCPKYKDWLAKKSSDGKNKNNEKAAGKVNSVENRISYSQLELYKRKVESLIRVQRDMLRTIKVSFRTSMNPTDVQSN